MDIQFKSLDKQARDYTYKVWGMYINDKVAIGFSDQLPQYVAGIKKYMFCGRTNRQYTIRFLRLMISIREKRSLI